MEQDLEYGSHVGIKSREGNKAEVVFAGTIDLECMELHFARYLEHLYHTYHTYHEHLEGFLDGFGTLPQRWHQDGKEHWSII